MDSIKISTFEPDLEWKPKSPLDIVASSKEDNIQSVTEFERSFLESFNDAIFVHRLPRAIQAAYNARKYTPPSYKIGDEVLLSKKLFTNTSSVRPSPKLCVRRVGPFRVTEMLGKNAVRVTMPSHIQIHPAIHVEQTARVHSQQPAISTPYEPPAEPFVDKNDEEVITVS